MTLVRCRLAVILGAMGLAVCTTGAGCAPGEEVAHRNGDETGAYESRAREIGDLPAMGDDDATTADDLCLDGCSGDDAGAGGDWAGAGADVSAPGAAGVDVDGDGDVDDDDILPAEPEPDVVLPLQGPPSWQLANALGKPFYPLPPAPKTVPAECIGGQGVKKPQTPCADATAKTYDACATTWTETCADFIHLVKACDAVAAKCPVKCPLGPNKQLSKPATAPPPLRFDLTAVATETTCSYPESFRSALYAEPHYVSVPRTLVGANGVPIKSVQRAVWKEKLDAAAYLFALNEPFWVGSGGDEVARAKLQSGATFANCVMARLESNGDLFANPTHAAFCKDIAYDSVVVRSPITESITKLVSYEVKASLWNAPGTRGESFRRFLIDFATRLTEVYHLDVVFVVASSFSKTYPDDWKKLVAVARIAPETYTHTIELAKQKNPSRRLADARSRYDKSLAAWGEVGVTKDRILLAEHYGDFERSTSWASCDAEACEKAGDKCKSPTTKSGKKAHRCLKRVTFGRAGVSESLWRDVMETRWKAGLAAGYAGNLTMGWEMPTLDDAGQPYRKDALAKKRGRRQKFQFDTYGKLKGN